MDFSLILGPSTSEEKKSEPSEKSVAKTDQPLQSGQSRHGSHSGNSATSSPIQPSSRRQTVSSLLNDDEFRYPPRGEKKNSISSILDNTPSSSSASSTTPTDRHMYSSAANVVSASPLSTVPYKNQANHRDQSVSSAISQSITQSPVPSEKSVNNSPTMTKMLTTESQHSPHSRVSILTSEGVSTNNVSSILNREASSPPPPVRVEFRQTTPKRTTPPSIANIITSTSSAYSQIKTDNEGPKASSSSSPPPSSIPSQSREGNVQYRSDSRLSISSINSSPSQIYPTANILNPDLSRRSSVASNPVSSPILKSSVYQSNNNGSYLPPPATPVDGQKTHSTSDLRKQNDSQKYSDAPLSDQPKLPASLPQKVSTESSSIAPKLQPSVLTEPVESVTPAESIQRKPSQSDVISEPEPNLLPAALAEEKSQLKPSSETKANASIEKDTVLEAVPASPSIVKPETQLESVQTEKMVEQSENVPSKAKIEDRKNDLKVDEQPIIQQTSVDATQDLKTEKVENSLEEVQPEKSDINTDEVRKSEATPEPKIESELDQSDPKSTGLSKQESDIETNSLEDSKIISSPDNSDSYETEGSVAEGSVAEGSVTEENITEVRPISNAYDVYNNPIPIWAQNYRTAHNLKPVVTVSSNDRGGGGSNLLGGRRSGYSNSVVNLPSSLSGILPFNDLTRKITTWLYVTLVNLEEDKKHVEVEIKLGKIYDKSTRQRVKLPIVTDTIIDFEYAKTSTFFEPGLTEPEFVKAKSLFDNLAKEGKRNPSSPTSITSFPERETTDIIMAERGSSNNLRITYNEEFKQTERITKQKIDQLLIHSPRSDHDFRITVSIEIPDKESVINKDKFISSTKRAKRRSSYIHKALQVDLTRVKTDDTVVTQELELEINQSLLLQYFNGTKNQVAGESLNFEGLIQFTVDNARLVVEKLAD